MSSFGANNKFGEAGQSTSKMSEPSNQFGRVYSILLTDDQKDADLMKVPVGSIGAIQFKFLVKGVEDANSITQTAYPIDARNRAFPVKNEVVEILTGPSNKVQDAETNNLPVYYYRAVVDMWGASEHNARPNSQFNTSKEQVTGEFIEKGDISRMKHLPGDYVIEGRFGNGVRFGSSNSKTKVSSPWSGPDGSPLVIISNGRKKGKLSFEDINKDGSSMYILSDQKIAFEPASLNFESYNVTMTAVQSSQVVKPDPVKATAPVPVAAVPPTEPVVVKTAVTASVIQEPLKVDEVEALPAQESTEGFQEFEKIGAMHVGHETPYWRDVVLSIPISNFTSGNLPKDLTDFNLVYLTFQQGAAGSQAIIDSAVKNLSTVPRVNRFTREDVQGENMRDNIFSDFGRIPPTPANFVSYWKKKSDFQQREAFSVAVPRDVEVAIRAACNKWGVPFDIARIVCFIESGYKPNAGDESHKGLFQVSKKLWRSRYPNEDPKNRTDIRKNADVGVFNLRDAARNVSVLRRLIKNS